MLVIPRLHYRLPLNNAAGVLFPVGGSKGFPPCYYPHSFIQRGTSPCPEGKLESFLGLGSGAWKNSLESKFSGARVSRLGPSRRRGSALMSQPRVTITFGRNGQRRATVSRDMYSDQINGSGAGGNRKRSVRERLGGAQEQASAVVRLPKRTRLDEGKWKHDMYEEKAEIPMRQPSAQDLDLRARLGRRNISRGQGEISTAGGMKDLREKLSGPIQAPQVNREAASQRRLQSVVRGSSGIASLATGRPGISRNSAITQKAPMLQKTPLHKVQPMEVDENSIAGFLQSLGLSKYLITFQAEEVDMAALRHMGDDDLKELGVPMGPRKKILLAMGSRG